MGSRSAPRLTPAFSMSSRDETLCCSHRPAFAVAPGERAVDDVADEAHDATGEMGEHDIEELVRAVGRIALKRRESLEPRLLGRRREFGMNGSGFVVGHGKGRLAAGLV